MFEFLAFTFIFIERMCHVVIVVWRNHGLFRAQYLVAGLVVVVNVLKDDVHIAVFAADERITSRG